MLCKNDKSLTTKCGTNQKHYQLSYQDTFDKGLTNWVIEESTDPNSHTLYVKEGVAIQNSMLQLTTIGVEDIKGVPYLKSGRVHSKTNFGYGAYLVTAKIIKHPGTWPAIWQVGPNWPKTGELDVMETQDLNPFFSSTVHCGYKPCGPNCYYPPTQVSVCTGHVSPPLPYQEAECECSAQPGVPNVFDGGINNHNVALSWFSDFRDYIWEWNENGFNVYIDCEFNSTGLIVDSKTKSPNPTGVCISKSWYASCPSFVDPIPIIFNIALTPGANPNTSIGGQMIIQKVQHYTSFAFPPPIPPQETQLSAWEMALIIILFLIFIIILGFLLLK